MKSPFTTSTLAVLAGIALATPASAQIQIPSVYVAYAGNTADTNGLGSVATGFYMGQYEVTNAQYAIYLNNVDPSGDNPNGIYSTSMATDATNGGITYNANLAVGTRYEVKANMGNKPVTYVSWYDALRFTNWLHNGQNGPGTTETGAYTLNGNTGYPTRQTGAEYWLPSRNEWYKTAAYDPTTAANATGNYWLHATRSDSLPQVAIIDANGNITNPGQNTVNWQNSRTSTVGSAGSTSFFGASDMNGNVWEWNDFVSGTTVPKVGGNYDITAYYSNRINNTISFSMNPTFESGNTGFRVATSVPEPSGLVLTMLIGAGFVCHRRRSL